MGAVTLAVGFAACASDAPSLRFLPSAQLDTIETAPDTPMIEASCYPKNDVRTSDLCAQWKAADAARSAADAAWWQVLLSGATLGAAAFAAFYAKGAVDEAKRSANAAHQQLAPRLSPKQCKLIVGQRFNVPVGGHQFWAYAELVNTGGNTASIGRHRMELTIDDDLGAMTGPANVIVHPNSSTTFSMGQGMAKSDSPYPLLNVGVRLFFEYERDGVVISEDVEWFLNDVPRTYTGETFMDFLGQRTGEHIQTKWIDEPV